MARKLKLHPAGSPASPRFPPQAGTPEGLGGCAAPSVAGQGGALWDRSPWSVVSWVKIQDKQGSWKGQEARLTGGGNPPTTPSVCWQRTHARPGAKRFLSHGENGLQRSTWTKPTGRAAGRTPVLPKWNEGADKDGASKRDGREACPCGQTEGPGKSHACQTAKCLGERRENPRREERAGLGTAERVWPVSPHAPAC